MKKLNLILLILLTLSTFGCSAPPTEQKENINTSQEVLSAELKEKNDTSPWEQVFTQSVSSAKSKENTDANQSVLYAELQEKGYTSPWEQIFAKDDNTFGVNTADYTINGDILTFWLSRRSTKDQGSDNVHVIVNLKTWEERIVEGRFYDKDGNLSRTDTTATKWFLIEENTPIVAATRHLLSKAGIPVPSPEKENFGASHWEQVFTQDDYTVSVNTSDFTNINDILTFRLSRSDWQTQETLVARVSLNLETRRHFVEEIHGYDQNGNLLFYRTIFSSWEAADPNSPLSLCAHYLLDKTKGIPPASPTVFATPKAGYYLREGSNDHVRAWIHIEMQDSTTLKVNGRAIWSRSMEAAKRGAVNFGHISGTAKLAENKAVFKDKKYKNELLIFYFDDNENIRAEALPPHAFAGLNASFDGNYELLKYRPEYVPEGE